MNVVLSALSAVLLAGAPGAAPRAPNAEAGAEAWLSSLCRRYGSDPAIPWALGHGLAAFGKDLRASDGRLAIDAMVSDSVERKGTGEQAVYRFPHSHGDAPVDPHSNFTVMRLVRAGLPSMRLFKTREGEVTLGRLVDSVRADFRFAPSDDFWREHAWTLDALASSATENAPAWKNRFGEEIDLAKVLDAAVARVAEEQSFLGQAMDEGVAMVPKRKQGLWSHPCGGLHLVQAAFAWMSQPRFRARHLSEAKRQVEILFYRLDIETRAYDEALDRAPEYALQINVQRLKFYGHWLETMMRLKSLGLWDWTPAHRASISKARSLLARAVEDLEKEHASERMPELKTARPQTYLDLIGDSCHAVVGLHESR